MTLAKAVKHAEKKVIVETLSFCASADEAAKVLEVSRSKFYRKLKELNIDIKKIKPKCERRKIQ